MKLLSPKQTQAAQKKMEEDKAAVKQAIVAEIESLTKTLNDLKSEYAQKSQSLKSENADLIERFDVKIKELQKEVSVLEAKKAKAMEPVDQCLKEAREALQKARETREKTEAWADEQSQAIERRREQIRDDTERLMDKEAELEEKEDELNQRAEKIVFYEEYWEKGIDELKHRVASFRRHMAREEARLKVKEAELIDRELTANARLDNALKKEARNKAQHIKNIDMQEQLKTTAKELKKNQ